jgi:hypothetical protein
LDGKGYPFKRVAGEINLGARVMAVADIFVALAEDRPYRKGMNIDRITTISPSPGIRRAGSLRRERRKDWTRNVAGK